MAIHATSTPAPAVQPGYSRSATAPCRVLSHGEMLEVLHAAAPIPSLPSAFSRRAALFGAVASTGFLAAAGTSAAMQATPEPIAIALSKAAALRAAITDGTLSDDQSDAAYDRMIDLEGAASEMAINTLGGAAAALSWARDEFARAHIDKADPEVLDLMTLEFLDKALGLLRGTGAAHV